MQMINRLTLYSACCLTDGWSFFS